MCRQAFATEGSQRTPVRFISPSTVARCNRPSRAPLSDIVLVSLGFSGSPAALRIPDCTAPFLGKGQQPALVDACCGLVSRRALLPEARSFDDKFAAVGASAAERGRSAQTCRTSAEFARKTSKRQQKKEPSKRQRRPRRYGYGVRTDAVRLRFRRSGVCMSSDELQRVTRNMRQRSVSRRIRCASGAIAWNNTATKWTVVP